MPSLVLNWLVDGDIDEQRYYCSETPIDVSTLPTPKAILAGDARIYVDTAVETGKMYYIAVGSVKNGVEKISSEIKVIADKDLYFSNVVSLLYFDGANNSTTFTDQKGLIWAGVGNPVISTAQSKFGGASGYFSAGNYLSNAMSSGFSFESSDNFTIECWVFVPSGATYQDNELPILAAGAQNTSGSKGGWNFALFNNSPASLRLENCLTNGVAQNVSFNLPSTLPRDTWIHVAICRSGTTCYGFYNGALLGTSTGLNNSALTNPNNLPIMIGSGSNGTTQNFFKLTGYLDDLRVTKGVARYTASFTLPSIAFPDN